MENTTTDTRQPPPPPDTDDLLYAYIHAEDNTLVMLSIFGRLVGMPQGTRGAAVECCNGWNSHFATEWMAVMDTNATIMRAFCAELSKAGVAPRALTSALVALQNDGE